MVLPFPNLILAGNARRGSQAEAAVYLARRPYRKYIQERGGYLRRASLVSKEKSCGPRRGSFG